MAAGACERRDMQELKSKADEIMRNTGVDDAIEVYKAFSTGKVKVRRDVPEFDVMAEDSLNELSEKGLSLYDVLTISASYDLISRELVGGFEKTFGCVVHINDFADTGNINEAISHAYLWLLSETEDTFVKMGFGAETSRYVKERAKAIVTGGYELNEIEEFDEELIRDGINPGSTADIIAAALFIAILSGLRF
jgi:triphosphoribosyl-dephospho-CoA synthase